MVDLFAISPIGLYPKQVVLRVLAYTPSKVARPGLRLKIQACLDHGEPIPESPLLELEGVPDREVRALLACSAAQGWRIFPFPSCCPSPCSVSY